MDPTIFLPRPTEALEVNMTTIVTVGVGIAIIMDAIGTDETVSAEMITAIIGVMEGVMMTAVATSGMTTGVIKTVTTEMATVVVYMGDIPITRMRSAAAIILVAAYPDTAGAAEGVLHTLALVVGYQTRDISTLLHPLFMHTILRVRMLDIRVHLLLSNVRWTERNVERFRTVDSRK